MCVSAVTQVCGLEKNISKISIWIDFFLKVSSFCRLVLSLL